MAVTGAADGRANGGALTVNSGPLPQQMNRRTPAGDGFHRGCLARTHPSPSARTGRHGCRAPRAKLTTGGNCRIGGLDSADAGSPTMRAPRPCGSPVTSRRRPSPRYSTCREGANRPRSPRSAGIQGIAVNSASARWQLSRGWWSASLDLILMLKPLFHKRWYCCRESQDRNQPPVVNHGIDKRSKSDEETRNTQDSEGRTQLAHPLRILPVLILTKLKAGQKQAGGHGQKVNSYLACVRKRAGTCDHQDNGS